MDMEEAMVLRVIVHVGCVKRSTPATVSPTNTSNRRWSAMATYFGCGVFAGLFAAKWSTRIEAEWMPSLERRRPDLVGRLGRRRKEPQATPADFAWALELGGLPTTAGRLREASELI